MVRVFFLEETLRKHCPPATEAKGRGPIKSHCLPATKEGKQSWSPRTSEFMARPRAFPSRLMGTCTHVHTLMLETKHQVSFNILPPAHQLRDTSTFQAHLTCNHSNRNSPGTSLMSAILSYVESSLTAGGILLLNPPKIEFLFKQALALFCESRVTTGQRFVLCTFGKGSNSASCKHALTHRCPGRTRWAGEPWLGLQELPPFSLVPPSSSGRY